MAIEGSPAASVAARGGRSAAFRTLLGMAWAIGLGGFAFALWAGRSYYFAPLPERPHHDLYWDLKPGGAWGVRFGLAGLLLMTVMHLYSARKRIPLLKRVGPLARWLDVHILFGVMGPLLVVLHSSLKVGGLVAISFWSMVAVAVSGLFGRYLYMQIPRSRAGDALSLGEARSALSQLTKRLADELAVDPAVLDPADAPPKRGLWAALLHVLRDDVTGARRRRIRARVDALHLPSAETSAVRTLLLQKAALERRVALWDELHGLFHYWHVGHKPFAVVMYVFVVVHVAVAVATGYAW